METKSKQFTETFVKEVRRKTRRVFTFQHHPGRLQPVYCTRGALCENMRVEDIERSVEQAYAKAA